MEWAPAVINWLLGLATLGLVGIIGMNVQLWVLKKQLEMHEENCLLKHKHHEETAHELWQALERLRERVD